MRCRPLRGFCGKDDKTIPPRPMKKSSCPTSLWPAPPLVGPRSSGHEQSVGPNRLEDDSWAPVGYEVTNVPRTHTIRARGTPPARGTPQQTHNSLQAQSSYYRSEERRVGNEGRSRWWPC